MEESDSSEYLASSGIQPFDKDQRSWTQKTFGKMQPGSLRGAVFSLISTAIGAGCLMQPLVFSNIGIFLGIIMQIIACFLSYYGLLGIAMACNKHHTYNYSEVVGIELGKKWGIFLQIVIIFYVYGTLLGYQIMLGQFVPSICNSLTLSVNSTEERIISMIAANVLIAIPLGMYRQLTSLRFISVLSAFTLIYITLLTIGEFPYFAKDNNFSDTQYFDMNIFFFSSFAYSMYAFTCHTNIAQVQNQLNRTSMDRIKKVAFRAMIGILVPYIFLGVFGYLSTLDDTPVLFIMREAPDSISNDWMMVISRVLMSVTLIFAIPINLPPCRNAIVRTIFKVEGQAPLGMQDLFRHVSVTLGLLLTTLAIAIVFPEIQVVFSLLGGVCSGIFVVLLPALLRANVMEYPLWSVKSIFLRGGFLVLMLIGFIGAILTSAQITKN